MGKKVRVIEDAAAAVRAGTLEGEVYADGEVYVEIDKLQAWNESIKTPEQRKQEEKLEASRKGMR
jgi:hypothetical protein